MPPSTRPIRHMLESDIPGVFSVQGECYGYAMQEDVSTLRVRLRSSPDTAWVAEDAAGICAYLVTYRSRVGKVTPLGGVFTIPPSPNSLYIHDLAIANRSRGGGQGSRLIHCAWRQAIAEGLSYSSLVSVQNSHAFWQRYGYQNFTQLESTEIANLHSYVGLACYMVKTLSGKIN